ncbi:hypothetical protein C6A86_026920 [Mycobacterium sp. ITM-2016-00316]|uniref:hypothetical protein n=1 Tax=Mycobacterium sp. ITM-2016-00316 TaxID=2099695 RepID=UPI000CF9C558|nr:hypothetical protein [Mycobacterium sp. ITM-2016-00316]WNG81745.1 hypothetical protein C6A86_026920 [Mycobacterium sp. ITM-2016-00316]
MSAFNDWAENPPAFVTTYDVKQDPAGWQNFFSRYTAGRGNPALLQVIKVVASYNVESILVETRYIDADWRSEHSRFYSTTYSRYPSIAHRAHFFTAPLPADLGDLSAITDHYKGYTVLRPLPSQPVGRTMIEPPAELVDGTRCEAIENVDVLGWPMTVRGMPFISQDAQYLRCAHSDVWMVLRHAYLRHQLGRKLPAEIHEATRGGNVVARQVPSEGLTHQQMMAGMATLGLSPATLALPQTSSENQAAGFLGLYPILCRCVNSNISPIVFSDNHVWLVVGYTRQPSGAHPNLTLYRHDDAAGPYMRVNDPWNEPSISHQPWRQVIIPLPPKIYMTGERAEVMGRWWFEQWLQSASSTNLLRQVQDRGDLTFRTYNADSSDFKFGLGGRAGLDPEVARRYRMAPWPRNLWVVEAVDRTLRGQSGGSVLGEVIVDPTANHYPSKHEPGILAAHAPGFWWMTVPDEATDVQGICTETFYESGRVDLSK